MPAQLVPGLRGTGDPSSKSGPVPEPPSAQSPFARLGRYLRRHEVQPRVGGRYPSFIALTGSCVKPSSSLRLRFSLVRLVFAGCGQPLLEDGPSRRYLHNLSQGAWTPTPPRSCRSVRLAPFQRLGASTSGHRPRHRVNWLGTRNNPCHATSTGGHFSGLQSFAHVQAP